MAAPPRRPVEAIDAAPRAPGFDLSLAFLAEGYDFMPRRYAALGGDMFTARLMLRRALCVRGEDAARMFYQPGRFTRRHALPAPTLALLQDFGSVTALDGAAHRKRKAMFMSLFGPLERQRLVGLAAAEWRTQFARWPSRPEVVVHAAAQEVLCRAVCRWAGIPVNADEAAQRTREFAQMIAGAGSAGPRNWRALLVRTRTEYWARALVDAVRAGQIQPPFDSPLNVVARHRDADGELMHRKHAAVELINLLRPTVAVARYIAFALLALHEHPHCRARIAARDDDYAAWFVQEVRRFYPFIPAMGGRALHAFDWHGLHVDKGTWVLFDLYGTNHHPALWGDPEVFRPERFERRESSGFDYVPHGGGDPYSGHRCPGESVTADLVRSALQLFVEDIAYDVPPQDLTVGLRRMPTLPASGFVIANVRPA
ncbi:cytochrome P450 [Massilia rhizosphaerae]|uniref:cytochrome P450 n=1 Tax=Massilia rhizosphaerae TaxID=2784389 RepID=UPI0018DE60C3|nr:cytochrome P450 [Massilia rhizosphaerae]